MKKIQKIVLLLMVILMLGACQNNQTDTFNISINGNTPTEILIGDEVDFKDYFIIKDSKGNIIEIIDEMIDSSNINLNKPGTYVLKIDYEGQFKEIQIIVKDSHIKYLISINQNQLPFIKKGDYTFDFTKLFLITDSLGNNIPVSIEMLNMSQVVINQPGAYEVTITYQGNSLSRTVQVIDSNPEITYTIDINESLSREFLVGQKDINFINYFNIFDSLGNEVEVLTSMLDLSKVNLNEVGIFVVTISFKEITASIEFNVTAPEAMYASDLFISEYSEGTSYNKYIEIFNGTGKNVDLSNYSVKLFNNATSPAQYELQLSGTLNDGETYIIYNGAANSTIKNAGNLANQVISFNGNDPIALYKNDVLIDVVGDLSTKVSDGYDIGSVKNATKDNTIIRKSNVYGPSATWNQEQWSVLGLEVYSNIKSHTMDYYVEPTNPEPIERTPDLLISEYFEGNGTYKDSKYIEIYNGLGYDVDLSIYALNLYELGNTTPAFIQPLNGILKHNDVYVVYAPYSSEEIKLQGDLSSEVAYFNGKHSIALTKNNEIIDLFGVLGEYPGTNGWMVDATSGTANNTLIRDYAVTSPSNVWIVSEWYVCYENYLYDIGQHNVSYEDEVITDFDILFNLIKNLTLNDKGTATSTSSIKIKGTVYMDVKNETTLVYITDGKNFIKLHGEKIHNYTAPNQVYEVTGNYKSYLYQPTFEVITPSTDIKSLSTETPVTNVVYKEVSLNEILAMRKENFVENINKGYLQSMLRIRGYLQLDTHNSTTWDYALTINETYTKNDTQYINNGLYFKNSVSELESKLVDYEVNLAYENFEIDIFGVIYDWNPNRKNWRIYVDDKLTYSNLAN